MGNCVSLSIPLDNSVNKVSQWLEKIGGYTHNLEKNLMALETTMVDLKAKRDDLSRKLKRQEDRGLQRLAKFQVWLNRVETIENRVDDILSARDVELQRLCLCGFCSKSLLSSYSYGKSVFLTLRKVEKLESEVFEVVADQALTPEVEERQIQSIIVGQETMLEKAWKHLMEDGVGIMGMYGMGGVGKTTLLSQIHNKFSKKKCGFDFVIWVVVSQELHVEKILDEIAQQVGLGGEEWEQKDKSQKGVHLYNFLKKKRFVLFLDDIWEKVDLAEIGVPDPRTQKRCKVAFTTRSQEVCSRMGVQVPMEVQCLAEHDAFDLFEKMVGQITLRSDPGIPDLARKVAKECCGLPLALNVIGETMSCKRTIEEWRHAIHVLSLYAAEFSDMEDKILRLLKYSYDSLNGEELKSCLLYCALYPEDYKIPKEELIEYWIGEGIIDGSKGIEIAHNKGYDVIGSLVRASLLMDGVNEDGEAYVRMHDVVREMALWIASDLGKQKEAFIVRAGVGLDGMPKVENWKVVGKMSLMNNKIDHLAGSPECLELTTLLLQRNETLVNISGEFFRSMPKLVVLDLSSNEILSELPDGISEMVSLKYLNLSRTNIECLPVGLQELKNLIQLDLEWTRRLSSIVGVSALLSLKVLKLRGSEVGRNLNTVEELLGLEHLEILTIHISCDSGLDQFLSSQKLLYCTQALWINGTKLESSDIWRLATMEKVRDLILSTCSFAETKMDITSIRSEMLSPLQNPTNACFLSLSKISLLSSNCCKELTWLMFAPNLTVLSIFGAEEVEEIINKEKALVGEESGILPFQKLQLLRLNYLPELKNIYWRYLPFPCLTRIELFNCLKLRKLPLNSKSGSSGLVITCKDRGWFEGVEWEDEATKDRFLSSAIQY